MILLNGGMGYAVKSAFAHPSIARKEVMHHGVVIHKRTPHFIDIEAPVDQVWVGCSDDGPTLKSNSLMMFYILDGNTSYEFFYRRMIHNVQMCLEAEREYRRMIQGAKTVRIVGGQQDEITGPRPPVTKRIPKRFFAVPKIISQFFLRLQTEGQCKAYFSHHCDLPKNYWAGIMPE